MQETVTYCKRLIEVDLPIKRISTHARREKSIRHGHISTLHIWWARRPLAACRAVICASLWPDPVDPLCPEVFRKTARLLMETLAVDLSLFKTDKESLNFFGSVHNKKIKLTDNFQLRQALLHFIADFANWDNTSKKEFLETSRKLTQAAHEALGGIPGTRPLVLDPFAGGGAIPFEAARVGAESYASDLNPVAVLLNKVLLEYIPRYGDKLSEETVKWGEWIKKEIEKSLEEFHPKDAEGNTPITYLWARTIKCEGPDCRAEVPLMKSRWLSKRNGQESAIRFLPNINDHFVEFDIIRKNPNGWVSQKDSTQIIAKPDLQGTIQRGNAVCPVCNYTTAVKSVRKQLKNNKGGAQNARLYCVVYLKSNTQGRFYRPPNTHDFEAIQKAETKLQELIAEHKSNPKAKLSLLPDESTPLIDGHRAVSSVQLYGMNSFSDLFTQRQLLTLTTISKLINNVGVKLEAENNDVRFSNAVQTCLSLIFNKQADLGNSLCRWESNAQCPRNLFGRQALPMVWDFAEAVPTGNSSGSWSNHLDGFKNTMKSIGFNWNVGTAERASATSHTLPDEFINVFFSDPPYYDAIPYADLSDFFYVWLKRNLPNFATTGDLTPKKEQAIVWHPNSIEEKIEFERKMGLAMQEGRRILTHSGIGVIVFAHKSTSGWEAQLQAMVNAGWIITGSWAIDTECGSRMNALGTATLASSVHLVCRPRENSDGTLKENYIGDWRDVLAALPIRIHEWMPRLIAEGVVGADAIFACLGPALEIFSRYSSVETPDGNQVPLRDYLEYVWAAIAKEAFANIFEGANASGFEEDARLTAVWFWAMSGSETDKSEEVPTDEDSDEDLEDSKNSAKKKPSPGYTMDYDTVRKLAQGLGVNLSDLSRPEGIITISGSTATLNGVKNRLPYLLGIQSSLFGNGNGSEKKTHSKNTTVKMKRVAERQHTLFDEQETGAPTPSDQMFLFDMEETDSRTLLERLLEHGHTTLDRLHQAMLLFSHGQTALIEPLLQATGMYKSEFWQLAQSLSALYPAGSDEKRLVDGLLAFTKNNRFVGLKLQTEVITITESISVATE